VWEVVAERAASQLHGREWDEQVRASGNDNYSDNDDNYSNNTPNVLVEREVLLHRIREPWVQRPDILSVLWFYSGPLGKSRDSILQIRP
jgi:hypothetical protein